jgi:hypothetical protein
MTLDALNRKTTAQRDGTRRSGGYTNVDHASLLRSASCMLETHHCMSVKCSTFYISRTGETSSRPTVTLARSPIKRQAKTVNALGRFSGERDLWLAGHPSPDPVTGAWCMVRMSWPTLQRIAVHAKPYSRVSWMVYGNVTRLHRPHGADLSPIVAQPTLT